MADPFLDAIGVQDPNAPAQGDAVPVPVSSPLDAAIRTIYAESSGDPTESQWIAGVIANRAKAGKLPLDKVVQDPGQFEPWADPNGRKRMAALDANSDDYKKLAALVSPILTGQAPDPTGGATQFYAPDAEAALGRPKPSFDNGKGVQVGKTMFFGGGAQPADPFLSAIGVDPSKLTPETVDLTSDKAPQVQVSQKPGQSPMAVFSDNKGALTPEQQAAIKALYLGGGWDQNAPKGSAENPVAFRGNDTTVADVGPGQYYIDLKGQMHRAPGGPAQSSFTRGLEQGGLDTAESVINLIPGANDSDVRNTLEAVRQRYGANYGGDFKSGIGRFVGQVAASSPLLAGGETALAPLARNMGAVGEFLAGDAGRVALPDSATLAQRGAQIVTRGLSLGAKGAQEGAAAGVATAAANPKQSVAQQAAAGAVGGAILRPAGALVRSGMGHFVGGALDEAAPVAEQQAVQDKAASLPVPIPLSRGDMTAAPAQQLAENGMAKGANGDLAASVVRGFRGDQQAAIRGNVQAISDGIAGTTFTPGEGAKAVSDKLNAMRDSAKAEIDAAYDNARAQGNAAMIPQAADVRNSILDGLRSNYDLTSSHAKDVASVVESLGENGAPTAQDLYDLRTKLSNLTQSSDPVEASAARTARSAFDGYIQSALRNDLITGDPNAIKAWQQAIAKRADFGKLFEGDDLIDDLTERTQRGGGLTLKVDPEEAANYIFNKSALGFAGKRNLGRDLTRLQTVLGPQSPEWNGLRAEVFARIARAGEGPGEAGMPQFSGQKFFNAWTTVKKDAPQIVGTVFSPDEQKMIDNFAEVAQRVTTPVKGGDNSSNSAFAGKRLLAPVIQFLTTVGGAGGGAAVTGGSPIGAMGGAALGNFMKQIGELLAAGKARSFTYGAEPVSAAPRLQNKLLSPTLPAAGGVGINSLTGQSPQ